MKLEGLVVEGRFGKESKSEHSAIYIDTGENKYRLKKLGGNPFYDETLHNLIGKKVSVEGNLTDYFFEMTSSPKELKTKSG
ncbi:hypothetical protein H9Q08_19760 [Chryseobacterium sp. PS-8]|uniref:YopX protein domain-containing protein n=1 Tax=Chryseobacterium indicum TaxID=2766954 RepID=A0ABS9CDN9_9FLAO|nr:hypothetical protein [Chryseobacterium sp. PS-8]MCF2221506.1 hypothetical protein [Chryseobacterium sp. PS-8]